MEHELLVVDDNDNEDDLVQVDDEAVVMESYASPTASQPPQPAPLTPANMMPPPDPPTPATPAPVATPASISTNVPEVQNVPAQSTSGRTMRSSNNPYATRNAAQQAKPKKLKLKLGAKATAQAPNASFLGSYDRELDSDADEEGSELLFEEHFVLRMPPGEECERLRKMIQSRDVTNDVWFKFKDSRRAQFHIGKNAYSAKLVDLPCIIESQKTFDNKHMFKVADISQMLVVEDKILPGAEAHQNKSFNVDELVWPHGVTPPLHWARKRRFRKRLNRRTIETVEEEVERLLSEDALADRVAYDVLENVNPDLSDSEFIDREETTLEFGTPMPGDSEAGDAPTPATQRLDAMEEREGETDPEAEGDFDEELAAELDLALGSQGSSEGESDEENEEGERDVEGSADEGDEDDEEDEDDEIDTAEAKRARKLLNEEIRDLEAAVSKKSLEIERSLNPLIRRRFEEALRKLRTDLDLKIMQRSQLEEDHRIRKEAAAEEAAEQEALENVAIPEDAATEGAPIVLPPSSSRGLVASSSRTAIPIEEEEGDVMEDDDMADLFGTDAPEVPMETLETQQPQPQPQLHTMSEEDHDAMDIG